MGVNCNLIPSRSFFRRGTRTEEIELGDQVSIAPIVMAMIDTDPAQLQSAAFSKLMIIDSQFPFNSDMPGLRNRAPPIRTQSSFGSQGFSTLIIPPHPLNSKAFVLFTFRAFFPVIFVLVRPVLDYHQRSTTDETPLSGKR